MLHPLTSAPPSPTLTTIVYRSKAVRALSQVELRELMQVAQARNERESVTGLMLYDNNRFFQWLEGPPDSVERVMGSIRVDKRHRDLEILNSQPAQARTFDGWTMKLAAQVPATTSWRHDVIAAPQEIVEGLRQHPEAAPALLVKLLPLSASETEARLASGAVAGTSLHSATAAILKRVILAEVIPRLSTATQGRVPTASKRAVELAELLTASDEMAARELIDELRPHNGALPML